MKLHKCNLSANYSPSKVQILSLNECSSITDISPFKDIPYIDLMLLSEVKDFSSLGKQRYLTIYHCRGLSDEAVNGFGNVFHLGINSCHNITEVKLPKGNNNFLSLISCPSLKSVELSSQDYIHVIIWTCITIDNFKIHGTVYSLDFTYNEQWKKETIPRKYQYLNGEEKTQ
jgi:hypothetical protein